MLLSLIIAVLLPLPAHADFHDFFGTVRFSKRFQERIEDNGRVTTQETTWNGSTRYLPGKVAAVSASYRSEWISEKRESGSHPCPWKDGLESFHDFDFQRKITTVSVNRASPNQRLNIFIEEDGSYKARAGAWGGMSVPNATKTYSRREFYDGCINPPQRINEQSVELSGNMESLSFEEIAGTMDPATRRLTGTWSGKDEDGGDLTYSWDLTMAEPPLSARIADLAPVVRAETVTLDAAPSTGPISKYTWEFTPVGDCVFGPAGLGLRLEGKKVSFPALCSFTAQLTVSNATHSDSATAEVLVQPREAARWKSFFQSRPGPAFRTPIFADQIHFGVNQCALHAGEQTTGHLIHTDAENNKTWRDSAYKLAQASGPGPFEGAWYVESQTLKIDRLERVNASLVDGDVFQLNKRKNNLSDLNALLDQVKKHAATHSSLVKDALLQLGLDKDPARQLEAVVGATEDATHFLADFKVREAETLFQEATTEENVRNRLRAMGLSREVKLWVPTRPDSPGGPQGEFLKTLGPLWNIGH